MPSSPNALVTGPAPVRVLTREPAPAGQRAAAADRLLEPDAVSRAAAAIGAWPGYAPTPLRHLEELAGRLGLADLLCKDDSQRLGVGTFKALGGGWAVQRALQRAGGTASDHVVCCASDGNHGRAVAWAARTQGARAVVFLPAHARPERIRRIQALGAETRVVPGIYDDAVRTARDQARANGWLLVSDTAAEGADDGASDVMSAYALIVDEVLEQAALPPTHLLLQAGVGGMAAALAARFTQRLGAAAPELVVVEPESAACVFESLAADSDAPARGDLHTSMDCLAAARVSAPAWPVLRASASAALTLEERASAMAAVAAAEAGVAAGPSGLAGLAGMLALAAHGEAWRALRLDQAARPLVLITEEPLEG